ncbi:RBP11-like subunits of RNA polymerase [Hyaloscypha variabilis F]|uniref:DNA-directed RNA polymerases I and III subunit RPAC1 n=1 Tax=Hyaloscypha variabilis (strain UAMH 11265 / GT02V1 / F) TaxID=1149755 RepID=A0A2J6QY27_HYAVF|nr:RBP11-like subunits of RNA polymerase [Hyaloscypha variabilis F]
MAPYQPSQTELDRRKIVGINAETVTDVSSTDYPGHYPGEDQSWDKYKFEDNFSVKIYKNEPMESSFSLIGIDAAVANAFRRIMIAEIPSLAIETVFVNNNTSIIQDEVLSARLGLVPFKGSKQGLLEFLKWNDSEGEERNDVDHNTVLLELKIKCTRNEAAAKGETDPLKAYHNAHVYAKDIVFKPYGRQRNYFSGEDVIRPTNPDILIAKLRPGQEIDVEMHAIKGVGSDHAKYSPVATASYRLLPTISILKPILGKDAEKFARCFPKGVIGLETVTKKEAAKKGSGYEGHEGEKKAVVKDAMKDTVSRECLRHEEFEGKVKLGRVRDHFIFSVESVGQWDSDELFLESVKILKGKCEVLKKSLTNMVR